MRRREFIRLAGGLAASPLTTLAHAQKPSLPVIAYLDAAGTAEVRARERLAAIRQALNEAGFVEGRNVAVEFHSADGRYERLPEIATDLVRRQVAVIAAASPVAALAAKAATASIPIVFSVGSDPVKDGLV